MEPNEKQRVMFDAKTASTLQHVRAFMDDMTISGR